MNWTKAECATVAARPAGRPITSCDESRLVAVGSTPLTERPPTTSLWMNSMCDDPFTYNAACQAYVVAGGVKWTLRFSNVRFCDPVTYIDRNSAGCAASADWIVTCEDIDKPVASLSP